MDLFRKQFEKHLINYSSLKSELKESYYTRDKVDELLYKLNKDSVEQIKGI